MAAFLYCLKKTVWKDFIPDNYQYSVIRYHGFDLELAENEHTTISIQRA